MRLLTLAPRLAASPKVPGDALLEPVEARSPASQQKLHMKGDLYVRSESQPSATVESAAGADERVRRRLQEPARRQAKSLSPIHRRVPQRHLAVRKSLEEESEEIKEKHAEDLQINRKQV